MPGCRFCIGANNCSVCELGFYLHDSKCVQCNSTMSGCSSCLSESVCMTCSYSYYLNKEGFCSRYSQSS